MTSPTIEELILAVETHQETGDALTRLMENAKIAGLTLPENLVAEWTNLLHRSGYQKSKRIKTQTDWRDCREYPIATGWAGLPEIER